MPANATAAVADWFDQLVPHPGNLAFLSFDPQVFCGMTPGRVQPLAQFGRPDYQPPET